MRNSKSLGLVSFCAAAFVFFACENSFFLHFEVRRVSYEDSFVELELSLPPNQSNFIDSFSFCEDGFGVSGRFEFMENKVYFFPSAIICEGHDYEVRLSALAESESGNSLGEELVYCFSTRAESIQPFVRSIFPSDEAVVTEVLSALKIEFSEPVLLDSLISGFSISPSVGFHFEFDSENPAVVNVILEAPLRPNSTYTVSLGIQVTDYQNNPIQKEFKSVFEYLPHKAFSEAFSCTLKKRAASGESAVPNLTEVSVKRTDGLVLSFSERVRLEQLSSYLNISPRLSYELIPDLRGEQSAVIKFNSPEWNEKYVLTIKKDFCDLYGRTLPESGVYELCFSDESDRPVEFLFGYFSKREQPDAESDWHTICTDNIYRALDIPVESGKQETQSEYTEKKLRLYLLFSMSGESLGFDKISVLENISVSATNNCAAVRLLSCDFLEYEELEMSEIGNFLVPLGELRQRDKCRIRGICCTVSVRLSKQNGLIKFFIGSDVSDNLGNCMKEDLVFPYNKI